MTLIAIGKKLVPLAQVAFVEEFDPAANVEFRPEKNFKSRLILLTRDVVLSEQTVEEFATEHELRVLTEDNAAVNPSVVFRVEIFEPTERFKPAKPYKTRLKWRDLAGQERSKLLLAEPQTVLSEILGLKGDAVKAEKRPGRRPARGRSGSRRMDAYRA